MKEIIYCVEILKQKHEFLNRDRKFYFKMQRFVECSFLRDTEKQIEVVIKKLLGECKIIIVNSDDEVNSELLTRYNTLINYFDLDFDIKKAKLEIQLSIQKKNLNSISAFFNFQIANQIREEIKETEKELMEIKALIKGENL